VSGSGGCNRLTGAYKLEENRLTFSKMELSDASGNVIAQFESRATR
jgi:heat shock protein HslJ